MQIDIVAASYLNPQDIDWLNTILLDAVAHNASVGFMGNLTTTQAEEYWQSVAKKLDDKHILLLAKHENKIVGAVQIVLATQLNATHRAEIAKLLVHSEYYGNSIAKYLMQFAEEYAKQLGIKLLVLDTQTGSTAEQLYHKLGWHKSGEIPDYALNPTGELCGTSYFFKILR